MTDDRTHTTWTSRATQPRRDSVRRYFIQSTAIIVLFTSLAFLGMYLRTESLLSDAALAQAHSYVDLVTTTRAWNAHYEGVWVEKKPGVDSNPYLVDLGLQPDIKTVDGRTFTLRNPSLMTREVSDMLLREGGVSFRLTSLKPVNPDNAPEDGWERTALEDFAAGGTDAWTTDRSGTIPVIRYMKPMIVESACLTCHAAQGYRVGDVRGAVSVTVPLTDEQRTLRENALWLVAAMLVSTLVLLSLTYVLVRRLSGSLERAEESLVHMATTDELTGLSNRRQTFSLLATEVERSRRDDSPLAVIMLDIDHFKRINDRLGHAAGDKALAEVASRVTAALRPYDLFGRLGGEEFLIVAPGASTDDAAALADRVRAAVATGPLIEDAGVVTLSAGIAAVDPAEPNAIDRSLARADRALYRAKESGRDRIRIAGPGEETGPGTGIVSDVTTRP